MAFLLWICVYMFFTFDVILLDRKDIDWNSSRRRKERFVNIWQLEKFVKNLRVERDSMDSYSWEKLFIFKTNDVKSSRKEKKEKRFSSFALSSCFLNGCLKYDFSRKKKKEKKKKEKKKKIIFVIEVKLNWHCSSLEIKRFSFQFVFHWHRHSIDWFVHSFVHSFAWRSWLDLEIIKSHVLSFFDAK